MSLHILETDHFTLLRHGHKEVTAHVAALPPADLAITVIPVEEQLSGWYTQVRKARDAEKLARAYDGLFQTAEFFKQTNAHLALYPSRGRSFPGTAKITAASRQTRPVQRCHRPGSPGDSGNEKPARF
jgi:hypothetical protein